MRFPFLFSRLISLLIALLLFIATPARPQPRLDVIEFASKTLRDNPLHDPAVRKVAVFIPSQFTNAAALPIVYYLPGYDNSSERFITNRESWLRFTQKVADEVAPVLFVVVDGRNRWGGSQYLNSTAQGKYADYICNEIRKRIESKYGVAGEKPRRVIAGHSSGGFGALRLGIDRAKLFDGVIALSPDSDFQNSHLPLVKVPSVTNVSLAQIKSFVAGIASTKNGDLNYALGLSAAYTPCGASHSGEFDWLYDANGNFRDEVWQRWLDNDPLTIVERNKNAFRASQSVYLEGAAQDQFGANVGAKKIYEVIRNRSARCTFYEPPGKHSDHLQERLQRGLAWFFGRPTQDIK